MDSTTLQAIANSVVALLSGALVKTVAAAAQPISAAGEELIKTVGKAAGERAAQVLAALRNKFKGHPAGEEALDDLVETPDDELAQKSLLWQIQKLLKADEAFAQELAQLVAASDQAAASGVSISASGDRSAAAGRDVRQQTVGGNATGPTFQGDIHGDVTIGS